MARSAAIGILIDELIVTLAQSDKVRKTLYQLYFRALTYCTRRLPLLRLIKSAARQY
jgi:hypothetical protein